MEAVEFESALARGISGRRRERKPAKAIVGTVAALAVVLCMALATLGSSQAVLLIESKSSVAVYMGTYDGVKNVLFIQVATPDDLVAVKTPVGGHLSELASVSYKLFVSQTGGSGAVEPYVVIKLTGARSLICQPTDSYSPDGWSLPYLEWQTRDVAANGMWTLRPVVGLPVLMPLQDWIATLGDPHVISVTIIAGHWQTMTPVQLYMGDFGINGVQIGLANAKRSTDTTGALA